MTHNTHHDTHNTNLYTIFVHLVILFFIIPLGGNEVCILSIDVHLYLKKIQLALIILPEIMDKNVFVTHNCRTYPTATLAIELHFFMKMANP